MDKFLGQYWDRTPEQLRVSSAVSGHVLFKEEMHAKAWDSCFMAVCPREPQQVDDGEKVFALVLCHTKRRKNGGKKTVVDSVKPLRCCDLEHVEKIKGNTELVGKLPKGVARGYIVTLSSVAGAFNADEFAFTVDKKTTPAATEAEWESVFGRVAGSAAVLKTGALSLQGQKKESHLENEYKFELKGPVLSYYDVGQKRLGTISFEDPNTDIQPREDEPDVFEVLSP